MRMEEEALLFGGKDNTPVKTRYHRDNWHQFATHRAWLQYQEEKRCRDEHLLKQRCGGSAKICGHCRSIDRLEQIARHARKQTPSRQRCWFAGMPYSKTFAKANTETVKPKYTAPISKYEAALARFCDVPFVYILDITRGDRSTRRLQYSDFLEEARNNCNYKYVVEHILNKKIGLRQEATKVLVETRLTEDTSEKSVSLDGFVEVKAKTRKVPANDGWMEDLDLNINLRIINSGLDDTCRKVAHWGVKELLYKKNFKLATIRKVLTYYKASARRIFATYDNKNFAEIRQAEREREWGEKIVAAAPTKAIADVWITKYWLKPLREILIIEKVPSVRRKMTPMSDFQRKVRYFKDGGVIARTTEGMTFAEVKAQRVEEGRARRVNRYFNDPSTSSQYPGMDIDAIKLAKLHAKYPTLNGCETLEAMKEQIAALKTSLYITLLKKKYPGANIATQVAAEAARAVDEYKKTLEYGVTAYFKDGGIAARKYPGKTVPEIKMERAAARASRWQAKKEELNRLAVKPSPYYRNETRYINVNLSAASTTTTIGASKSPAGDGEQIIRSQRPRASVVNITNHAITWDVIPNKTEDKNYSDALPTDEQFGDLPQPLPETKQHSSLKIAEKKIVEVKRQVPFEKKCTLKYHIGSVPHWDTRKQLIQSYSADVRASAGFAKVSEKRYPLSFREKLREVKPEVGHAYLYANKNGTSDVCLITKVESKHPTSELSIVDAALQHAASICKSNVMMPKIETGCNKQKWEDIEPLIKKHFKGKTVHIYSREAPENYGNEPRNGKEIVNHRRIITASKGKIIAYCKHSVGMVPVVGCEKDLIVSGGLESEYITMVLEGVFDDVIKNRNAALLRPGKSGVLMKECWTKNAEIVDWLEGPSGRYCMVSGVSSEGLVLNSLKTARQAKQYYNPVNVADVLYTEMLMFTDAQTKVRNQVDGWCVNLCPSRRNKIVYHVHECAQGKCIVMSTHRCAPRLWVKLGFSVKIRGDKIFISTYDIERPADLWATLPALDHKIKYMAEAEIDAYQVTFKTNNIITGLLIKGELEPPFGWSGILLSDKKPLQGVKQIGADYELIKVYRKYRLDLAKMEDYGEIFTNAVQQRYTTEGDVKTYSGGFTIHQQPPNYDEIMWLQTLGFSFGSSMFEYGSQKGEYQPGYSSKFITDTAAVLFTEMGSFTEQQKELRNPIQNWCTNINPSRKHVQNYHVYEDLNGKTLVLSTHTCAPRLWMKLGFYVKIRGDKTFISTTTIDNPDELWTTLPLPDGKIKYMAETEQDSYTVDFVDKHTISGLFVGGLRKSPAKYSGLLISDKKTLQSVKSLPDGTYNLARVYKGYVNDLPQLLDYGDVFRDAIRGVYNTHNNITTYSGGFVLSQQVIDYDEVGWFQTLAFTFEGKEFAYGAQIRNVTPCNDKEGASSSTISNVTNTVLEATGLKAKKKKPRRRSRSRSTSRVKNLLQDERRRYQKERLVDDIVRMEERLRQLKINVRNMEVPKKSQRKSRKESDLLFGNKCAIVGLLFILLSFIINLATGAAVSELTTEITPVVHTSEYVVRTALTEAERDVDQANVKLAEETVKLEQQITAINIAVKNQTNAVEKGEISMAYITEQVSLINERNKIINENLDECLKYLDIVIRVRRTAESLAAQRTYHNLQKAEKVRDIMIARMDSMKETLERAIETSRLIKGHLLSATTTLQELEIAITNNTANYNRQVNEAYDMLMSDHASYDKLTLNQLDSDIMDASKKLNEKLDSIRRNIHHPQIAAESYTRVRRQAKQELAKHCRVGSALGTKTTDACCFKKPDECEITNEAERCTHESNENYLGRSNFGCQLSYTGVVILKNGRTMVDMNITTALRRCSMSCLPVRSLVNILQVQPPYIGCVCGYQGLLFKNGKLTTTTDTEMKSDILIWNNETILTTSRGNWTFTNMIEFSRHCCKAGSMANSQNETTYRDGYCMCKDKIKIASKSLNIKYSWMLEGAIGWILALYLCRSLGLESVFLTLTILGVGGSYYVSAECTTDNFIVVNPVGIKTTTAYLNIHDGTCFSIGDALYQVQGIYTERLYTWKHSYLYDAYAECQHSAFACRGGIGNFCDEETECHKKCQEVRGAYKTNCVIRSGFDFSDCVNIDVNVKGELCVAWRNDTIVRHYESASEAVDQYVIVRVERGSIPTTLTLHVGTDENSESIGLTSLIVASTLTTENIYILNQGQRCSPFAPQEGEICTVGGLNSRHIIQSDCLEADLQWNLEKKEFKMQFTKDQMKNWLNEYSTPCESLSVIEESNITLRVKQRNGKGRITIATYEDTNLRGVTICQQVTDTRVKVELGKGEWLSTSKVTLGARTPNECLITLNADPCTIIGPTRRTVSGAFTWQVEVACGIITPTFMKFLGGETVLAQVKLPKLYTDINYDITYGIQTLQVTASRLGDIIGNVGDYSSFGHIFTLLSKDMLRMIVKTIITLIIMYVGWICLISGLTPLGLVVMASSIIPWVTAEDQIDQQNNNEFDALTIAMAAAAVCIITKVRNNKILRVCTLPQYLIQLGLRKLASTSVFEDQYHTARVTEDALKLLLIALNTHSIKQFLVLGVVTVCFTKLTTLYHDIISAFMEGIDVSYEHDVYCTISMQLARIIPNKTWYKNPIVCIDGMGSPQRKLNRPMMNMQTAYRAILRSDEAQVFMHEVVNYFIEHEHATEYEAGTCKWTKQDGKISGAKHTLKLCGCNWCVNHEVSFDVVGKQVDDDVHYDIVQARPTEKSGTWKADYGVYHGYVEHEASYVKVYNLNTATPDNDHGKALAEIAEKALLYVQQQQYTDNSRGRENGNFTPQNFCYGDLTQINRNMIRRATTEVIIRDFRTYTFTDDIMSINIDINTQASAILYDEVDQIVIDEDFVDKGKLIDNEFKVKYICGKYIIGLQKPSYVPITKEWNRTNAWQSFSPCMKWFELKPSQKKIDHLNAILKVKGENKLVDGTYWTEKDGMIFTAAHAARLDWLTPVHNFITVGRDIITIDTSKTGRVAGTALTNGDYIARASGKTYKANIKRNGNELEINVKVKDKEIPLKGLSGMTFSKGDKYFTITIGSKNYMYLSLPIVELLDLCSSEEIHREFAQTKKYDTQLITVGNNDYALINHKKKGSTLIGPVGSITKSMVAKWPYMYHTRTLTFASEFEDYSVYEQHKRGVHQAPNVYSHSCGGFTAPMRKTEAGGLIKIAINNVVGVAPKIWVDQYGIWHSGEAEDVLIEDAEYNNGDNTGKNWRVVYNTLPNPSKQSLKFQRGSLTPGETLDVKLGEADMISVNCHDSISDEQIRINTECREVGEEKHLRLRLPKYAYEFEHLTLEEDKEIEEYVLINQKTLMEYQDLVKAGSWLWKNYDISDYDENKIAVLFCNEKGEYLNPELVPISLQEAYEGYAAGHVMKANQSGMPMTRVLKVVTTKKDIKNFDATDIGGLKKILSIVDLTDNMKNNYVELCLPQIPNELPSLPRQFLHDSLEQLTKVNKDIRIVIKVHPISELVTRAYNFCSSMTVYFPQDVERMALQDVIEKAKRPELDTITEDDESAYGESEDNRSALMEAGIYQGYSIIAKYVGDDITLKQAALEYGYTIDDSDSGQDLAVSEVSTAQEWLDAETILQFYCCIRENSSRTLKNESKNRRNICEIYACAREDATEANVTIGARTGHQNIK